MSITRLDGYEEDLRRQGLDWILSDLRDRVVSSGSSLGWAGLVQLVTRRDFVGAMRIGLRQSDVAFREYDVLRRSLKPILEESLYYFCVCRKLSVVGRVL